MYGMHPHLDQAHIWRNCTPQSTQVKLNLSNDASNSQLNSTLNDVQMQLANPNKDCAERFWPCCGAAPR